MLKTLRELWNENGKKPFKAVQVIPTKGDDGSSQYTPVGTIMCPMEEDDRDGYLKGIAILPDNPEEEKVCLLSDSEREFKKL